MNISVYVFRYVLYYACTQKVRFYCEGVPRKRGFGHKVPENTETWRPALLIYVLGALVVVHTVLATCPVDMAGVFGFYVRARACGQSASQSRYSMPWLSVSHVFCLFVLQSAFTNVSILGKWTTSHSKVQAGFHVAWNNLQCRGVKGRLYVQGC